MGNYVRFLMLLLLKGVATALFRSDAKGIDGGRIPGNPWDEVRLICFLNHTSLYEPLFAAAVPTRFMWQIACRSVVPIAEITLSRPILGRLLRLLIAHPVAISREPDETWQAVLKTITEHKDAMVIIMPEGRMRRANGLDRFNKPMTARGGVTHILKMLGEGKMLMAYSGGLHHVQIPGQLVPKMFKTIRMRFELLEISAYLAAVEANSNGAALKNAIKADLDERRDRYCPMTADSTRQPFDLNVNTRLTGPRPETTVH